jgi:hypothetical protein
MKRSKISKQRALELDAEVLQMRHSVSVTKEIIRRNKSLLTQKLDPKIETNNLIDLFKA